MQNLSQCSDVLVQDVSKLNKSITKKLAWLKIIQSSKKRNESKNISMQLKITNDLLGRSDTSLDSARVSEVFQKYKFDYSHDETLNMYSANLSPKAINAWAGCMQRKEKKVIQLIALSNEETHAIIKLIYNPPGGLGSVVTPLTIRDSGISLLQADTSALKDDSERTFICDRIINQEGEPAKIVLVAEVNLNESTYTESIELPYYEPQNLPPTPEVRTGSWLYINPRRNQMHILGHVGINEKGYVQLAGQYTIWKGNKWLKAEHGNVYFHIFRKGKKIKTIRGLKKKIKVPSNCEVQVQFSDTIYSDNKPNMNNPLKARLVSLGK